MARVSTYLNFSRKTEEAFTFYKSVFRTEYIDGIQRMGDAPDIEGQPPVAEADKNLVMHVQLPILAGHVIMGTDSPQSMGISVNLGNSIHINLEPDSREETQRLFDALSEGGNVVMPMQEAFWGAYFGACVDKFGVNWMFNHEQQ